MSGAQCTRPFRSHADLSDRCELSIQNELSAVCIGSVTR